MPFTIAIVGRPNVGKSTLFNRLVGSRLALVHDQPGVTRDIRLGNAALGDLSFQIIDTAGLEEATPHSLAENIQYQTEKAIAQADAILFVIDARAGITPLDHHFVDLLRRQKTPVIIVANKCEGNAGESGRLEAYALGFGDPIDVSADHGLGLDGLYDALESHLLPATNNLTANIDSTHETVDEQQRPLQLAIVGRPNTGKSTLVNRLIGEQRLLTGPEPGVTRDAIQLDWNYEGRAIRLVDTAGIRRRSKIKDAVEKLSVADTYRAIKLAEVVVLVMDAAAILDKQELTIARKVIEEGRALVVAVNKWDMAESKKAILSRLRDRLEDSLPQVRELPTVTISAKTGLRVGALMGAVFDIYELWNKRIQTAALNQWLDIVTQRHPPPLSKQKRRIKLRYITQIKSRPPTYAVFTTRPEDIPDSYVRYLVNNLRNDFSLGGVPIRIVWRKPDNPYDPARRS